MTTNCESRLDYGERPPPDSPGLSNGCTVAVCTYKRADSLRRFLDSLAKQSRKPDELLLIDASRDSKTERMLLNRSDHEDLANAVTYLRVSEDDRGLTRQRNLALKLAAFDVIAFFDDDVVLGIDCVLSMEKALRENVSDTVGVGAFDEARTQQLPFVWRIRRALGIVHTLKPGMYCRSGVSTPWNTLRPTHGLVEVDWVGGFAMMWITRLARRVRFCETFHGYAQGEDLHFSLRMGRQGKIYVVGAARLKHLPEPAGRPNRYRLGYMELRNRHFIHCDAITDRTIRDSMWFVYAWSLETIILMRNLVYPNRWVDTLRQLSGRCTAAIAIALPSFSKRGSPRH